MGDKKNMNRNLTNKTSLRLHPLRRRATLCLGALLLTSIGALSSAQAQVMTGFMNSPTCRSVFTTGVSGMAAVNQEVITRFKENGRKVENSVALVDGREDWKVDYEFVAGDPKEPLVILANGFVWPRENSGPLMNAIGKQSLNGGRAFNVLRYDMSGQGQTVAAYDKNGPKPWWMKKDITLEDLQHEMADVAKQVLKKNGLPGDHPVIMMGLSYGRAILSPELAQQSQLVVEIAPMIIALSKYQSSSALWRSSVELWKMNPFTRAYGLMMQRQGWVQFYKNFYQNSPGRMPPNVVPEWYMMGSALRTNAAEDYDARKHIFTGVPHFLLVSEVDDAPLIKDQFDYFQNSLAPQTKSALLYMHRTAHGQTADFLASEVLVNLLNNVNFQELPQDSNVFRFGLNETNGKIVPTSVQELQKLEAEARVKRAEREKKIAGLQKQLNDINVEGQKKIAHMNELNAKLQKFEGDEAGKENLLRQILEVSGQIQVMTEQAKLIRLQILQAGNE